MEISRTFEQAQEEAMPTPEEPPDDFGEDQFFCIATSAVGNPEAGYEWQYYIDPRPFKSPLAAWNYGFQHHSQSDDLNVGVLRDGQWVATLWGPNAEVVEDEPAVLTDIPLPDPLL